mmetsp:Transcript_18492/g.40242  ORF Transcript_18492/g.40242 Transcript_18492/m.40242 type:complete len:260 (+) Transcript_18492:221-1000(+)
MPGLPIPIPSLPRPNKKMIPSPVGSNDLTKLLDSEQWELATQQCQAHPNEACGWSTRPGFFEGIKTSDVLPIHIACSRRPTSQIIDALYEANAHGFRAKETAYRRLPLHIACRSDASPEVIKRLLHYYSDAAAVDDSLGRLPLHYRLSNGADPTAVDALLEACPGGARAFDKRGWLPVHVACSVGASLHVVKELVEAYPASVLLTTNKGSTPLKCMNMALHSPHKDAVAAYLKQKEQEEQIEVGRKAARPSRDSMRMIV